MLEIINCDQNNQSLQKQHNNNTRKKAMPNIPRSWTKYDLKSFLCNGIRALNNLTPDLLSCNNIKAFVKKCKKGTNLLKHSQMNQFHYVLLEAIMMISKAPPFTNV